MVGDQMLWVPPLLIAKCTFLNILGNFKKLWADKIVFFSSNLPTFVKVYYASS
jgi:hypothetical protein